ncbi:MAG TPA: DegQ family serine endoprotease [Gammaproteobacteria bacterium]|nr:DegQ family serine endoprotease [Gammaproteobacteria bacterium]
MINRSVHAAAFVLALFALASAAWSQPPLPGHGSRELTLAPLVKKVTPAVVNISVESTARAQPNPLFNDPFFRRFFDAPQQQGPRTVPRQSVGSGVIVDAKEGYVLTNHHVIEDADHIVVTLQDKRQFVAKLVGSDKDTDIALLKIDASGLAQVPIGDSDQLEVGDYVVAIGNPFALGQTVTAGIVSALGRTGLNIEGYEDFIQTDASINPGNSGGALIDMNGQLVGINTAILSPGGRGNVGIGFAVPSNMARLVMDQLIKYGQVNRGQLGVHIQSVTPALAQALNLSVQQGAVVTQVEPGSAAEKGGLQAHDIIVAVNGHDVQSGQELRNMIGLMRVGSSVRLDYLRDGERRTVELKIGKAGETAASSGAGGDTEQGALPRLEGANLGNLPPGTAQYGDIQGVLVSDVAPGSAADRAGLEAGDVILGLNRMTVHSVDELNQALRGITGPLALDVMRGSGRLFVVIP